MLGLHRYLPRVHRAGFDWMDRADRVRAERDSGDKTAVGTLAADRENPRLRESYRAAARVSAIFSAKNSPPPRRRRDVT